MSCAASFLRLAETTDCDCTADRSANWADCDCGYYVQEYCENDETVVQNCDVVSA